MATLQINLDGEALKDATVQAMLGSLSQETRAQILEQSLRAMLAPSTNSWEKHKSPIEMAFERAIDEIAREEAKRLVSEDEVLRERIKELLRSTADKVLSADTEKLAERMATAFVDSMRRE